MHTLPLGVVLVLVTLPGFAQAGAERGISSPTSPPTQTHDSVKGLIKRFAGSWSIHLTSGASNQGVNETAGKGEETWRAGPGSNSLIEEYHSTGSEGEIIGLGIYWHAENEKGLKVFWCDNTNRSGCRALNNNADWKDGRLVLSEHRHKDGKDTVFEETFVFDSPDSFTQTLAEGQTEGNLRPFLTIRAIRKKP
jgi:hypothetical protein